MHIVEVHETNWIDRNVIQVHHLIERMVNRGHTCEIIDYDMLWPTRSSHKLWEPKKVFTDVNRVIPDVKITVIRPGSLQIPLLCHAIWAVNSLIELKHLCTNNKPAILLASSLTNSYFLALFARYQNIPFAYMIYEPYYTMVLQKWLRPIAKAVEKLALRAADRIFVFTPQMKRYSIRMGVQPDRIDVFKSGVGPEIFAADVKKINRRKELGIEPNEWVVFFMGWLYDFSGLRQIVQEIVKNPDIMKNARLLIVGDGDLYSELKSIVMQNNLSHKIIMTGKQPYTEIPELIATANVCLMPSLENDTTRDIVPMKVYEYMASNRPLVATQLPGMVAEFGYENGILYTEDPIDALKQALRLANEPAEVEIRSEAGRRFAEQNANWDLTADFFEAKLIEMQNIKSVWLV